MNKKWFRNPENGESIYYDCGCVYVINYIGNKTNSGYQPFEVLVNNLCFEHDPTLTDYAKQNEKEYIEENC